ncbi:MAG: DoxX family protein [Thermoleophilaceae bacterium]|nr:DoxX family protein [Thermoleophilaceae bacterium]MDQ3319432.1 DoxX family protein [Actinomycetota bacterium]MDQ3355178.1 DoxX family protein [Actinomycetota bacterium]
MLTTVRVLVGLQFVLAGLVPKFLFHGQTVASFDRWGLPAPELFVYAVGSLEVVGGLALVAGFVPRWAAAVLTVDMAGALLTAGLVDGGVHLLAPPILAALLILIAVRGGAWPVRPALGRHSRSSAAGSDPPLKMASLAEPPSPTAPRAE